MSTSSQLEAHDNEGFFRSMFTNPLARNFQAWVSIVNFWIFISCLTLAGETVEPYASEHGGLFKLVEYAAVLFFTIDYLGNLYFAKDRVKYFFSFWGLVDLISIVPTYLMIMNLTALQGSKVLRVLRVVRVLRVLKMARIALQQIQNTLESSNPILTNLKIYFIALFSVVMISSTLMYYAEGNLYSAENMAIGQAAFDAQLKVNPLPEGSPPEAALFTPVDPVSGNPITPDKRFFTSIPAAMWWCIVTLTTTGYGDMYPVTFWGRVIAGSTMLMGLVLFGILLNIVGKTIMVMLFGEQITDDDNAKATRENILGMMVIRGWISQQRANEIELLSEEDIKSRTRNF
jgi:voltage-gated potassium channel